VQCTLQGMTLFSTLPPILALAPLFEYSGITWMTLPRMSMSTIKSSTLKVSSTAWSSTLLTLRGLDGPRPRGL
jgi:hypothetical protein